MNQTRRTMVAALQTPSLPTEAFAFIKEGTPKPQTQAAVFPAVSQAPSNPQEPARPMPANETSSAAKPKAPREKSVETVTLISMNFRVPGGIPQALLKASSERKMKKIRPYTQQDIVSEALSDWLRKNGYLS